MPGIPFSLWGASPYENENLTESSIPNAVLLGVRGWIGSFGPARQFDDFADLDGWIRRRVRMCYWKQWRCPRTKVKKLVALGVSLDMAIKHAVSRKKSWRMSSTPELRYAMTNKWLAQQGLLSLKQLWYELASLRGTA
ncbi:MAG: group II intron maturase-specific domain-containing protein [Pirellulaceae bacterium]|nr:hypothetical protein [Planctomycetales bacterium]